MAHRHSVAARRARRVTQPAGLWIVDAQTKRAFELQAGSRPVVIPAGRTVESLMEAVSQLLDTAVKTLRQMPSETPGPRGAARPVALDDVVALLQQARGMHDAAYETLVDAAINLGKS